MRAEAMPPEIEAFIAAEDFPCIMAQAAMERDRVRWFAAGTLGTRRAAERAMVFLHDYLASAAEGPGEFESAICGFDPLPREDEAFFEQRLWAQLQHMHELDRLHHGWDERVSADPDDPEFSFSLRGEGLFVVGMHPGASRPARRAPRPLLVFNLHQQFEELRRRGTFESVKETIRERDEALAGSINPMLADFGERSEAVQYAGRAVAADWRCPLEPRPSHDRRPAPRGADRDREQSTTEERS